MNYRSLYSLLSICILLTAYACEKRNIIDGTPSPYIAIQDLRTIHKDTDVSLDPDRLSQAEKITGVVISDYRNGNVPDGMLIIQQHRRNQLHGIALQLGDDVVNYLPGDSLIVHVANKELKREGFLYISHVTPADIEKVSTAPYLTFRTITAYNAYLRPNDYEGTLVKIVGAELSPRPTDGETLEGVKHMLNGADTLSIHTQSSADFAATPLPRNVNATGILLRESNTYRRFAIWPRYHSDIEDVSDPEIPGDLGDMPLIITGFCNDPAGGDGNYEYVQLMANTDIDFSEIPFSIVTSNNAGSVMHTAGWATGGARTYKFNLTEGSVKKGEFFYVGGSQKRINGANSTSIANANWIRTITYASTLGDGLGNNNSNLLANSGNASGIALFVGTNISESTIPIDVVFYGGTGTASIIDLDLGLGYRIANNDHYTTYSRESGELTPFFSMGEGINDFRHPHHGSPTNTDIGYYFMLGGEFNTQTREWTTPRTHTLIHLDKPSTLAEIETGPGITKQVE
ncbi:MULTISPECIES: DUF5689 domain-containing protein [Sphingobacterium]|uniref:DUF5689 domain-containing protein n=1 Tax=Sphingobacterium populi TaxID=1812824 RepID=A0ABW5UBI3_9SPHI|nr:DUF5689 domain-containing protein [Sphingobacterium sp. CFCC 11742]